MVQHARTSIRPSTCVDSLLLVQVIAGREVVVSTRADIFSFGVVLRKVSLVAFTGSLCLFFHLPLSAYSFRGSVHSPRHACGAQAGRTVAGDGRGCDTWRSVSFCGAAAAQEKGKGGLRGGCSHPCRPLAVPAHGGVGSR